MPSQLMESIEQTNKITEMTSTPTFSSTTATTVNTNSNNERPTYAGILSLQSKALDPSQVEEDDEDDEEDDEDEDYIESNHILKDKTPSVTALDDTGSLATKSAFEITSVSHVSPDDTEDSILHNHTSKDGEELSKSLLLSGNRHSTSSNDSELEYSVTNNDDILDTPTTHQTLADKLHEVGGAVNGSNPSPKPPDIAVVATATNGPSQQTQSRFRRINKYVRGRWAVRDSLEPESDQRPESEMKMAPPIMTSKQESHTSPSIARKSTLLQIERNYDNEVNGDGLNAYVRQNSVAPAPPTMMPTRDGPPESLHSLSRTGSVSSIRDGESIASMPLATPDINSTYLDRQSHRCDCDDCSNTSNDKSIHEYQQGIENAISHLHSQFLMFFQTSPYRSLLEERNKLAKDNERLKEQVLSLQKEIETLKSTNLNTDNFPSTST